MLRHLSNAIWRRVLLGVVSLAAIYAATDLLPGDSVRLALGPEATPEAVAQRRSVLGLDRPLVIRLAGWFVGLARGEFGTTVGGESIGALLASRLPWTLLVGGLALGLVIAVAIPAGTWWAMRGRSVGAGLLGSISAVLVALPEFVVGTLLIIVFALALDALPAVTVIGVDGRLGAPDMLVLPVLTLALPQIAWNIRVVRAAVLEALALPHVEQSRLDGLGERLVVRRHVLPLAAPTIVTSLATTTGALFGGAVIVETLFNLPGLGSLLAASIAGRDPSLVTAVAAVAGMVVLVMLVAADATRAWASRGRR